MLDAISLTKPLLYLAAYFLSSIFRFSDRICSTFWEIMKLIFILCLLLVSCGPSSLDDYKELGKVKTRKLIEELQKIQNRDQLMDAEEALEKCYQEIAELMLSIEKFRKTHPKASLPPLGFQDHELSDKLRFELLRICRFDGGREILEKIRIQGLNKAIN